MMESRILNELESARVDVLTLQTQLLNEQKKAIEYQQVIVDLRKEVLDLKSQAQELKNDKALLDMGIVGNNRVIKLGDGKYKIEPFEEAAKS